MRVKITKSPNQKKKFRAILEDGRTVDFGAVGIPITPNTRILHVCVPMCYVMGVMYPDKP